MPKATMNVIPRFENFIFDWDYETYLLIGSYGSGKSHSVVQKIILKLFEEKRKACVIRAVYDTHKESTYDLIREVLENMGLLAELGTRKSSTKVIPKNSPLEFKFPNGSRIIFKGMDNTEKVKSLNGVSIVWFEECSELSLEAYVEMLGRIRTPNKTMHFILTCNPVSRSNWVYKTFFRSTNEDGTYDVILDENVFYNKKTLVRNGIYYHHSTCDDNEFLPQGYINRLDSIKQIDEALWVVARLGRFGTTGLRVLPNFTVMDAELVRAACAAIPPEFHRIGMDFGFETSFNAVVKLAIDTKHKYLYVYKEYYKNRMTDAQTAEDLVLWDKNIKKKRIKADSAEPKAIKYYRDQGFNMIPCRKLADRKTEGSRIANTKKMKRFRKIICSTDCENTINECRDLTYKKDKNGELMLGTFNIDPHTFSAMWYALDDYNVSDYKERPRNTKAGEYM